MIHLILTTAQVCIITITEKHTFIVDNIECYPLPCIAKVKHQKHEHNTHLCAFSTSFSIFNRCLYHVSGYAAEESKFLLQRHRFPKLMKHVSFF